MPLNGSDFVSSKSPVSVKSQICSRNRSDASILKLWKMCMIKTTKGAHEKAPQRLKEENQNENRIYFVIKYLFATNGDNWVCAGTIRGGCK